MNCVLGSFCSKFPNAITPSNPVLLSPSRVMIPTLLETNIQEKTAVE